MKLGLGTVKGKILAGTMATGLVVSGGVAFANTDAGAALQNWYEGQFDQTVDSAKADIQDYGESKIPGLVNEYNGLKTVAADDINATKDSEIKGAVDEINAIKDSHMKALGDTKEELKSNMEKQFYDVYQDAWLRMNQFAEQGVAIAENDLISYTGTKGQSAVKQVTEDLNAAKDDAVTSLESAIKNAQEELTAGLDNHEKILVDNMKTKIDFKIEEVREQVNVILDDLVVAQQDIIATKALELENAAKIALDDVVSGINK